MIDSLKECVSKGESLGADFVEARFEDLVLRTLHRSDEVWKDIQFKSRMGYAINCYVDGASGFSFSASSDRSDLNNAVEQSCRMAKASARAAELKLPFEGRPASKSTGTNRTIVRKHPADVELAEKVDMVNRMVEAARERAANARNIRGLYGELYGRKMLANSDGSEIDWEFLVTDLRVQVAAKSDSGAMVMGYEGQGGTFGLERFNTKGHTPEDFGHVAGETAVGQLKAKMCPAGKFRALIDNDLAGVLAHESFGHLSEADFVVTGGSPLCAKVGATLGTEHASITDGASPSIKKYGGLWVPFDDQGIPSAETRILDKGTLRHYLHDRGTAKALNQEPTGNSRAVDFTFPPIVRMTNTYFEPGALSDEEAIELLGTGVYAIQTAGGQVEGDGSFLFKAVRGYWVEKGEIQYPILEVALSGNILDLLGRVEGTTRSLKILSGYFGGCGKGSQFPLPVGLGGPELVIGGVTFGGQA